MSRILGDEADVDAALPDTFEGRVARGLTHRSEGDLSGALRLFTAACQVRPDVLGARSELAFTHLQAGSLDHAQAHYLAVFEADPRNVAAMAGLADISRRRGEIAAALRYLKAAVVLEPARIPVRCDLADVLREAGHHDEAEDVLRDVLTQDPSNWRAFVGLGLLARRRGDHGAAAVLFEHALDSHPGHRGVQLEMGRSLRDASLNERAAAVYRSILERDPSQLDALVGLAVVLRRQGELAAAVPALRMACDQKPEDAPIRLELAATLRELAQYDQSDGEYRRVLEAHPQNWLALVGRALISRQRGDHESSLGYLGAAVALQPEHAGLQGELALTLRLLERFDQSEAIYQRAHAADPQAGAPLHGLSLLQLARGRSDSAIRFARAALDLEPDNPDRMTFLASLYRDAGRLDDAVVLVEAALARAPHHAGAWMERALGLRSKNDRATALQAFEHVAAIDPGRGLIEVAHEQVALGKPEAARHTYRQVLAMLPMNYPAMLGLTELELLAANYEACVAVCDELISAYPMRVAPYRQKARALLYLDRADCAISLMQELEKVNGPTAEADAALLEILRTCGRWHEAQAVLALPRVAAASAFPLWFETVLTRLTFFDLSGAKASLERPPAVRPFEHSRVTYAQGVLADLEWRVDDAIRGFQGALTLHAQDSGAHHHLARLHLLKADADGAMHHLRCMNQLNLSALSMRGESVNVSQNLIGQLVNELRLDRELHVRLAEASRLEPHLRIDAMAELVRFAPALTPPAMGYLLALRQSGQFDVEASGDMPSDASALRIPRKLMQFWDQRTPPQDITDLLRTWVEAHPGYSYSRFDNLTAREYLADHYPREVSKAFGCARHPAQASDLFRLAHLLREGGFYVDADDRCVGDLAKLITTGTVLVGYQEQYATLGNNFLGCIAGEPVIERALALAVETLLRGDSETIWLATGPGLLTRAFAEVLLKQASGWQEWLRQRRILDRNELSTVSWPHSISQYKNTRRSWLRSGFKSRVQPT